MESFKRLSGLHVEDDGKTAVVWLGLDPVSRRIHVQDAALFATEPFATIAWGIGNRGRNIPLAWRKQDRAFADQLLEYGIDVLPDPCEDTQAMSEVVSREIWQRIRVGQFLLDHDFSAMRTEYEAFNRADSQVPMQGYPLMAATRHAMEKLDWAKAETFGSRKPCAPKICIV